MSPAMRRLGSAKREAGYSSVVSLEPLSSANIHAVLRLRVAPSQRDFYPRSNGYSISEGTFPADSDPVWMRAICHEGVPVGFMMTSEAPASGDYFLWRLMIGHEHQGRGYGAQAMTALISRLKRTANARVLLLSHVDGNDDAGRFFARQGFRYTGHRVGGQDREMQLRLDG